MINRIVYPTALVCFLSAGCAGPDVNPAAARPQTGYVDFYTDSSLELSWEVRRADEGSATMRTVFSKFNPVPGTILRLAAPPGNYRFQVWFSNRATEGPQTVPVEVLDGRITPVRVTLIPAGSTLVQNKDPKLNPGATRLRRGNRISYAPGQVFSIRLAAGTPEVYRPKEKMPYFSAPP